MPARPLLVLLALLITRASYPADNLRIDQVSPDSRTYLTATFLGVGCGAKVGQVSISGNRVLITAQSAAGACTLGAGGPVTAKIGILPAGAYDVALEGDSVIPSHTTLVVRGIDPARAIPFGGPTTGGNRVVITTDMNTYSDGLEFFPAASVKFGGTAATIVHSYVDFIEVTAPPHAAGDVDLTFTITDQSPDAQEKTYTIPAAYRYYDAAAAPDPFLFEPILYPIAFRGMGAHGAEWATENFVAPHIARCVTFWKTPCSGCALLDDCYGTGPLPLDPVSRPDGIVLWVDRASSSAVSGSCRVRDLSRQAQSAGVNVPLVREGEFRASLMLINIPTDSRYRAMLRLWCLDPSTRSTSMYIRSATGATIGSVPLVLSPPSSPDSFPFVSVDLTPILEKYSAQGPISLAIAGRIRPRVWGIVSITNNDTQEVTVVTPQ